MGVVFLVPVGSVFNLSSSVPKEWLSAARRVWWVAQDLKRFRCVPMARRTLIICLFTHHILPGARQVFQSNDFGQRDFVTPVPRLCGAGLCNAHPLGTA